MSESGSSEIVRPDKAACVFCRQRKIKCDRSKPDCTNCAKSGMQCWYLAGQRKPGLRAGYVSALERRLASVEHQINDLKSSKQDQPGPASAQGAQELQSFQSSPASTSCPNGIHHLELSRCEQLLAESTVCSLESRKDLCTQWFEKYHPWFPILHRIAFSEEMSKPCLFCSPQLIVFKAILAVIGSSWGVPESKHPIAKQFDEMLRKEIILDAIDGSSLRSLQALLILTIMDYGNGKLSHVWNLLSVCKRKSTGLGLRDLAANKGDNFNEPSTIPPRMLPKPASLIEREDSIRAYWITEALDSSSTVGAAWNLGVLKPENMEWIRCREDIWTSPESIDASSLAKARFSATFSLYVGLVCNEIYLVHHFLQTSFDLSVESERKRWRAEAMALEKKLENWQTQRWNQDFLTSPNVDQESPYIAISIVIACTFQMAKIALYQRLAYPTAAQCGGAPTPWPHAVECCLDACRNISCDVRLLGGSGPETISPQVTFAIFVAARFILLHSKRTSISIDPVIHDLRYALMAGGRRWTLAARLDTILRAAIDEFEGKAWKIPLPIQFWDLQYLSLDIDEALRLWAERQ